MGFPQLQWGYRRHLREGRKETPAEKPVVSELSFWTEVGWNEELGFMGGPQGVVPLLTQQPLKTGIVHNGLIFSLSCVCHALTSPPTPHRRVEPAGQDGVRQAGCPLTLCAPFPRPALAPSQLAGFLGTLESVLRYRATVLQTFHALGRFTVNEAALSAGDALLLLHRWALMCRDTVLQEALKATVERLVPGRLLSECAQVGAWDSGNSQDHGGGGGFVEPIGCVNGLSPRTQL